MNDLKFDFRRRRGVDCGRGPDAQQGSIRLKRSGMNDK